MTFLKTLLIILLVYFGLKILWKFFAPTITRYLAKKMSERFERAFQGGNFQEPSTTKEGNVTIETPPKPSKTSNNTVGEYVDYEEVE